MMPPASPKALVSLAFTIGCLALSALDVAEGQQVLAPGDHRVEGVVIDAETGQLLEDAQIQISPSRYCCTAAEAGVSTGAEGDFKLPLKTDRQYALQVRHTGYVPDLSTVLRNCSPCNVTIRLHAESKLSGRVLAADTRQPIPNVRVDSVQASNTSDIIANIPKARALTDRDGRFHLEQLTPGQYFFRFSPAEPATPLIVPDDEDSRTRTFLTQLWPGGDTRRNASPFTILAGTVIELPDILLPVAALYRVTGTVPTAGCDEAGEYAVSIGERKGSAVTMLRSTAVRCGKTFVFADMKPGQYEVRLQSRRESIAMRELVVTDHDELVELTSSR